MEAPTETRPGVTVVIPTLDRTACLITTVLDLLDQDYRPLELLIVDQSAEAAPEAIELARANPDVITYHHVDFRGLPTARNFGWSRARFPLILFVDDDIRCPSSLVRSHVASHALQRTGIVAGGIDEPSRPSPKTVRTGKFNYWTGTPEAGFSAHEEREVDLAPGGNMSTWKNICEEVGGFDEQLNVGAALHEETDFCLRVKQRGYRVVFNPKARLTHLAAPSGGCRTPDPRSYMWSLGHNRALLIRRHLRWFQWPTAVARVLLLGASISRAHRSPGVLIEGCRGLLAGWTKGRSPAAVTSFPRD